MSTRFKRLRQTRWIWFAVLILAMLVILCTLAGVKYLACVNEIFGDQDSVLGIQCRATYPSPSIQNHTRPALGASPTGPFIDIRSLKSAFGCDYMGPTEDLTGGLRPAYPMLKCILKTAPPEGGYFYREPHCWQWPFVRYLVQTDGQVLLLSKNTDLQKVYAPIESEDEALSYAIAATGLEARYGLKIEPGIRYFVPHLEDTHVTPVEEGYLVYLFDFFYCGCYAHYHHSVTMLVTRDGQVRVLKREIIAEGPAGCMD